MALEIIESRKTKKALTQKQGVIIAVISLILGVALFTLAYAGIHGKSGIGLLNQPLLSWIINHRNPTITNIAKIVTTIASPIVFAAIVGVVAIIWAVFKQELWRPFLLVASVGAAVATSTLLKTITMDARPPQINMIPTFETDFSFPSGHTIAMITFMLVFGYVIYSRHYSATRFWGWVFVALIGTGVIAATRLYLGYHWLTDVVASIGLGFVILSLVILVDTVVVRRFKT